jgi:diguanylate cyclase (GGDEF)-like protein
MGYDPDNGKRLNLFFTDRMPGGAFIYRASEGHELLYANKVMADLFECDSVEEFREFVGNSFDGIVGKAQLSEVQNEINEQITDDNKEFDHVFYYIRTKKGNVCLVEDYGALVHDSQEGDVFYVFLISREISAGNSEIDHVTGLYARDKFFTTIRKLARKSDKDKEQEYALIYLNMVNFKLFNLKRGVAEGDACLKSIGEILKGSYEDAVITRLWGDHFAVFTKYENLVEKHERAARTFREMYGKQYNIYGKNGVCRFKLTGNFDVEAALSKAKVACDSIKHNPGSTYIEYSDALQEQLDIEEYVEHHIDEAVEKGWIIPYYQPQIRSITGQLCGMEALARWQDPVYGLLTPNKFVDILEESRQLHKLDCYMVQQVCRDIRDRMNAGLPMVPVSLNFSRLDFKMCDALKVVEDAVRETDIPRDFINIEITETIIASDKEKMEDIIDSFRNAGYQVWMDDFGSAYSSLNVLKDYEFDLLKLDMKFLMPFTDKARNIVRAAIFMAKTIDLKTLAEGVETPEQVAFLKQIGCGRLQGYYFGRPEPLEDVFAHLEDKGVETESRLWRRYYDIASIHVRESENPLELIEDDGENITTLYMNKPYREQMTFGVDMELEEIDQKIYHTNSPLLSRFREYANHIEETGNLETFYYSANGNYMRFQGRKLAECNGRYLIEGCLHNITIDQNVSERLRLDSKLRDLNLMFDVVYLLNVRNKTVIPLLGRNSHLGIGERKEANLDKAMEAFEERFVYYQDRNDFREFMDPATIKDRVDLQPKGYVETSLRLKLKDGSYTWYDITVMMVPGTGAQEYLACLHRTTGRVSEYMDLVTEIHTEEKENQISKAAVLWDNAVYNSKLKFFWKDRDRRFRGVSKAFLDFYGIKSENEILGKTDEEMHWHVNDQPYMLDELAVIEEGRVVEDIPGQCIVGGVVHRIACRKMPIYDNGQIIGLVGSFRDLEEERWTEEDEALALVDPVTGLMTARSLMGVMIDYAEQYNLLGKEYGLAVLRNTGHKRIEQTYGRPFAESVLGEIGKRIIEITGQTCAVARVKDDIFVVVTYKSRKEELEELTGRIRENVEKLTSVEGNSVTIRTVSACLMRSEEGVTDENIYPLILRKIEEQ